MFCPRRCAWFTVILMMTAGIFFSSPLATHAADTPTLLKQADKLIRQAQRNMFAGKSEVAIAELGKIQKLIGELKEADPNNNRVKSTEKKYQRLVRDLERRTGKKLGGGTLTAAETSRGATLPSKKEPQPAGDDKSLARKANKLLREAEKGLYAGKHDMAAEKMNEAKAAIDQLKSVNPRYSRLRSLERKQAQIEKKLARSDKTPKTSTRAAAPSKAPVKAASSAKLPFSARRPYGQAKQSLQRVEDNVARFSDPKNTRSKESLIKNMDSGLKYARKQLTSAKEEAAKKGVSSHPDLEQLEADLAAAEKKVAEAKVGQKAAMAKAAVISKEVQTDVKAMQESYEKVSGLFQKATGTAIYYNDLKPVGQLIGQIEAFEKTEAPQLKQKVDAFAKKYGTTRQEIEKKAEAMGYSGQNRASFAYSQLVEGMKNMGKTRTVMADDLVRRSKMMMARSEKRTGDFARMKNQAMVKEWSAMAARYDSDNPRVKAHLASVNEWIQKDTQALNAKIDKAVWPKTAADAPKDHASLKKAALAFIQKETERAAARTKKPRKLIDVTIIGPWRVFKKNLLGEPIQYGLPVATCVQYDSEKEKNLARVYFGSLLTRELRGVKMAPPFIGAAVGNNYYIRPSAVKP